MSCQCAIFIEVCRTIKATEEWEDRLKGRKAEDDGYEGERRVMYCVTECNSKVEGQRRSGL